MRTVTFLERILSLSIPIALKFSPPLTFLSLPLILPPCLLLLLRPMILVDLESWLTWLNSGFFSRTKSSLQLSKTFPLYHCFVPVISFFETILQSGYQVEFSIKQGQVLAGLLPRVRTELACVEKRVNASSHPTEELTEKTKHVTQHQH